MFYKLIYYIYIIYFYFIFSRKTTSCEVTSSKGLQRSKQYSRKSRSASTWCRVQHFWMWYSFITCAIKFVLWRIISFYHNATFLCLVWSFFRALICSLSSERLKDIIQKWPPYLEGSECYTATIRFSFTIRIKTHPSLLRASRCWIQDVWVFFGRLPPSPWESVPVRPALGKDAAKEGLSADMAVSSTHYRAVCSMPGSGRQSRR